MLISRLFKPCAHMVKNLAKAAPTLTTLTPRTPYILAVPRSLYIQRRIDFFSSTTTGKPLDPASEDNSDYSRSKAGKLPVSWTAVGELPESGDEEIIDSGDEDVNNNTVDVIFVDKNGVERVVPKVPVGRNMLKLVQERGIDIDDTYMGYLKRSSRIDLEYLGKEMSPIEEKDEYHLDLEPGRRMLAQIAKTKRG